jgi:hypothetical protein
MLWRPPTRRQRVLRWLFSARPLLLAAEFFTVLCLFAMALVALVIAS